MTTLDNKASVEKRLRETEMLDWLRGGAKRADGRLAIFDQFGEPIRKSVIQQAIKDGLAEPWFANPMRPQWTVCRLTEKGRRVATR